MIVHLLPILMFVVLMLLVFTSYPIGFVLGGISIIFGVIGWMSGVFSLSSFLILPHGSGLLPTTSRSLQCRYLFLWA